jgi:hypothetical protein
MWRSDPVSGCWDLKVNLKAKFFMYVNSTSQRCPDKIMKNFLIEDFFHLPPVSATPVVHLELRISPRIFEKNRNGPNCILMGLGETDSCKNQKLKISWHCPFKRGICKLQYMVTRTEQLFSLWMKAYSLQNYLRNLYNGLDTSKSHSETFVTHLIFIASSLGKYRSWIN